MPDAVTPGEAYDGGRASTADLQSWYAAVGGRHAAAV